MGKLTEGDIPRLRVAISHYEQAVAHDSNFAQAWARQARETTARALRVEGPFAGRPWRIDLRLSAPTPSSPASPPPSSP